MAHCLVLKNLLGSCSCCSALKVSRHLPVIDWRPWMELFHGPIGAFSGFGPPSVSGLGVNSLSVFLRPQGFCVCLFWCEYIFKYYYLHILNGNLHLFNLNYISQVYDFVVHQNIILKTFYFSEFHTTTKII